MNNLLRILTVHSAKELLKYKSFFFLIFFLVFADRVIHRFVKTPEKGFGWPSGTDLGRQTAEFVFAQLPEKLFQWLMDPRVFAIAAVLFLLKQVISLWPSSDMRRMHRKERGRFGVMEALAALRWYQMAWDALAVGWVCVLAALWIGLAYVGGWVIWSRTGNAAALYFTVGFASMAFPVMMAGFSYSSKLAVIRHGTFGSRFRLFLELFINWRLLWTSWLFFCARISMEAVFVAIIPAGAILLIESFWLRIAVAALSATPVYAYLKMASFKFFLEAFRGYDLVRQEYQRYYDALKA
jgi:F0F1-type ATP synthase membrane subunit c/vacuolar-type H+-ATPase subunit K